MFPGTGPVRSRFSLAYLHRNRLFLLGWRLKSVSFEPGPLSHPFSPDWHALAQPQSEYVFDQHVQR